MFKRNLKYGLLAVVGGFLAVQGYAAEVEHKVSGEVSAVVASITEKNKDDSYSYLNGEAEATLGYEVKTQVGSWTAIGALEFTITDEKLEPGNRSVTLEQDNIWFAMGNWDSDYAEITVGKSYLDSIDEVMAIGNDIYEDAGGNYLKFGLKSMGLEFTAGFNSLGNSDATGDDGAYNETLVGASLSREFGSVALNASYTSVSEAINDVQNSGGKNSIHDGGTKSEIAVGVGFQLGTIGLGLNLDQFSKQKGGNPEPDESVQTTAVFILDFGIDDESGITLAYGMRTLDDGTDEKTQTTGIDVGYMINISGADLSVGYSSVSVKDDDDKTEDQTNKVGLGLTYAF